MLALNKFDDLTSDWDGCFAGSGLIPDLSGLISEEAIPAGLTADYFTFS